MNLVLLISQVALFLLWPRSFSRRFFFVAFVFWRAAYNAGLGWILTKQSKRKWIVREVCQRGWLDDSKRPKVRAWIRKQLSVKMGRDYDFDVSSSSSLGGLGWTWFVVDAWGAPSTLGGRRSPFMRLRWTLCAMPLLSANAPRSTRHPSTLSGMVVPTPISLHRTRSTEMGLTRACSRIFRTSHWNTIRGSSSVK